MLNYETSNFVIPIFFFPWFSTLRLTTSLCTKGKSNIFWKTIRLAWIYSFRKTFMIIKIN